MGNFKEYFRYISFFEYVRKTKIYKQFYDSKAGWMSIGLTLVTVILLKNLYGRSYAEALVIIEPFVLALIAGLLGLLGFIISGLAIVLGMVTDQALKRIDNDKQADSFVNILFSFFFEGAIIGTLIILLAAVYFGYHEILPIEIARSWWCWQLWYLCFALVVFVSYFSILYAIGLLGTLLGMFFVNLKKSY